MNSPRFLADAWEPKSVHSRDTYGSLWREVSRYAGGNAADRVFNIPGSDSRNVSQFRRAIALADEYWISYEDSPEVIDVVPLYYGALSLGNAIAYATFSSANVAQRSAGHGLSIKYNLNASLSVAKATLSFGSKTDAFGMVNDALGGDDLTGRSLELLDLLRALPDLSGRLEHLNQTSTAFEVTFSPGPRTTPSSLKVLASVRSPGGGPLSTGFIRDNFAIGSYLDAAGVSVSGNDLEWTTPRAAVTELDNVSIRAKGSWWLLPKLRKMLVPEYSLFLAALYTLSVFARYVPDYWLKIRDDHTDEWVLIRDFVSIAEEKIPWLALNHFSRASHEFVSPA